MKSRTAFIIWFFCYLIGGIAFAGMMRNALREDIKGFTIFALLMIIFLGIIPYILKNVQQRVGAKGKEHGKSDSRI